MDKIAILVLAHKNERQLSRLLQALDDERFDFFVHIDSKSAITPPLTVKLAHSQVHYTRRIDIGIFDYTLIQATCACMEAAKSKGNYKYYVLITGQDYPIKSNDTIYQTLMEHYPMNWIDSYGVDDALAHGVTWVTKIKHRYVSQPMKRFFRHTFGNKLYYSSKFGTLLRGFAGAYSLGMTALGVHVDKMIKKTPYTYSAGSHFWMLTDQAVDHVLSVYHNDKQLTHIFNHVRTPEESYFQTVLSAMPGVQIPNPYGQFESPLKQMDNPALRLIKWFDGDKPFICHPGSWGVQDMEIIAHASALFARKFDEDDPVLDLIDKQLR